MIGVAFSLNSHGNFGLVLYIAITIVKVDYSSKSINLS